MSLKKVIDDLLKKIDKEEERMIEEFATKIYHLKILKRALKEIREMRK